MYLPLDRIERVRKILSARGLTLYRVSQQSAQVFGRSSRFYVPHNLYYDVADPSFIPTIHQMLALSHITDFRLSDWLAVFGLSLEMISRLQMLIPRRQTTPLDSSVYDARAWVPWFANRFTANTAPAIAPLRLLLKRAPLKRAGDLVTRNKSRFLYGRVGEEDMRAFPHFAPGSIVRVDLRRNELLSDAKGGEQQFFFVELYSGWTCSRIRAIGRDRIILRCPERPCLETELTLGREARILGRVDAEIRPLVHRSDTRAFESSPAPVRRRPLVVQDKQTNLKNLIRTSRIRAGLTFRDASSLSRGIANTLSDKLYFAAPSTLSDYETLATPPRHIQKIIALCVLYGLDFRELLRLSGLPLDREGLDPMPDELAQRSIPRHVPEAGLAGEEANSLECADFLGTLSKQWEEIPLFLRHSFEQLTGLKNFSLSDIFWVGGDKAPIHPLLAGATFVAVNRRVKKPAPGGKSPLRGGPIYVVLKRDGNYVCGACTLDKGNLILDNYSGGPADSQEFRNEIDAEVVGQVTAILRRFH